MSVITRDKTSTEGSFTIDRIYHMLDLSGMSLLRFQMLKMSVSTRDKTSAMMCVTMYRMDQITSFVICVIVKILDSKNVS